LTSGAHDDRRHAPGGVPSPVHHAAE
jgi:hypothetical protein